MIGTGLVEISQGWFYKIAVIQQSVAYSSLLITVSNINSSSYS